MGSPPIIPFDTRFKYGTVSLKHHTSELPSFDDLAGIETYGFHGEALSSLCTLFEAITVTISTLEVAPMATVLEFDKMARVLSRAGRSLNRWDHKVSIIVTLLWVKK